MTEPQEVPADWRAVARALGLAELACSVAERARCEGPWRSRLGGYTLAFLANARRAKADLQGAQEDFAEAWKLWREGAAAEACVCPPGPAMCPPGPCPGARNPSAKAYPLQCVRLRDTGRHGLDAERRIREVMAEVLEIDPGAVGEEFAREEAPSWDSLRHLRMVTALEEAFGIRFTMKEVGEMERFEVIRRLVTERLAG